MKNFDWNKILELACRWYVFLFLNFYGLGKILGGQFYRRGQLPEVVARTTIGEATAYDLAWSFMGFSFAYILFIGLFQLIGAWLLLWNRTKLLGVMILFPIMVNIVVFDIIFLDIKDAVVNAVIYLLMLLNILYFNKERVIEAFVSLAPHSPPEGQSKDVFLKRVGITLLIMAIIFGIDQFLVSVVRSQY